MLGPKNNRKINLRIEGLSVSNNLNSSEKKLTLSNFYDFM